MQCKDKGRERGREKLTHRAHAKLQTGRQGHHSCTPEYDKTANGFLHEMLRTSQ